MTSMDLIKYAMLPNHVDTQYMVDTQVFESFPTT